MSSHDRSAPSTGQGLAYRFIEPLDVLLLRGNQSFGDPGSYGDSLMPPWPSVAAGAIRSRMLADDRVDLAAFSQGKVMHPSLGTPAQPGSFVLQAFHLARRVGAQVEILVAAPADLFIEVDERGRPCSRLLVPTGLRQAISTSCPLPLMPVLAQQSRGKVAGGWWLTQAAWQHYLAGRVPDCNDLLHAGSLWGMDERIGVGLSNDTRSADDGKLFTNCAVALKPGVGFMVAVGGASAPDKGLLRLGGDGRAASIEPVSVTLPEPDYEAMARQRRCRLVLSSPGLFTQGWLPNGVTCDEAGAYRFDLHGVTARLVAACVARSEIVSGWDLARWQPKPAQRIAPTGSVYWLDDLQADADSLRKLVANGLWGPVCEDAQRRAEGFNRACLAQF